MQRSSDTIGTIAAALAKAQAQLVNPEKSLIGTIRSDGPSASERSFRYAPRTMSNRLPSNRVWFAVGDPPMPIICALHSRGRLAVR